MAKRKVAAARAQVFERTDGWRFRVKGGNGEVLATGEAYTGRSGRANALAACRAVVPKGTPLEIVTAAGKRTEELA